MNGFSNFFDKFLRQLLGNSTCCTKTLFFIACILLFGILIVISISEKIRKHPRLSAQIRNTGIGGVIPFTVLLILNLLACEDQKILFLKVIDKLSNSPITEVAIKQSYSLMHQDTFTNMLGEYYDTIPLNVVRGKIEVEHGFYYPISFEFNRETLNLKSTDPASRIYLTPIIKTIKLIFTDSKSDKISIHGRVQVYDDNFIIVKDDSIDRNEMLIELKYSNKFYIKVFGDGYKYITDSISLFRNNNKVIILEKL